MLDACPSFRASWEEFLTEWKNEKNEKNELSLYIALSELARHLIAMLERGETESFGKIFDVVERWHTEGDGYVREAATVGLLEDLQNGNLHLKTEPEQFRPFLRPESLRWWDKLNRFWEKGELLTDD